MSLFRTLTISLTCFFLLAENAVSQTTTVRVLASNGMKAVIEELQPKCEKAIGHPLAIEYNSTSALQGKIEAGAPFDVAIITSDAIAASTSTGKLAEQGGAVLSRSGIGFAIRAGAPKPDIGTAEALKKTLLAAKSITYAKDGASRVYLDKMFDRLGIETQVKPKLILTQGSGPAMESVASGQAAVVMTLISELLPVHGIDVVGPLPRELQSYVRFSAAIGSKTDNLDAARALIAFFRGSTAAPVYKAKGMEQVQAESSKLP
jgi:molybdate transport system substrate-binding protein